MKIVLSTFGSRGDVQPMLALSLALQAKGHAVLLAAPPEKAAWANALGCPFHPLGSSVTAFSDKLENAHSLRAAMRFLAFLRKEIPIQFEVLPQIIAGADLVIGSSLVFALPSVAEAMGITYRYIAFTPQLLPSGHHPFPAFKHQRFPKWYNRITWRTAELLDRFNFTRLINHRRRKLGLRPVADAWRSIMGHHVLVASDKIISEVPPDVVAPPFKQTGYMHLRQPDHNFPELAAFLEAKPPPVYAGFGSMPKNTQIRSLPMIANAIRSCGRRAVVGRFWDAPGKFSHADDILFVRKYPHLDLFPHMAAVIHHGGAGTTASCAISGVPQIIVPHVLDQYYWGHQVYKAGLGPRPIWYSKLTGRKLAAAIQTCLSNAGMRQKSREVSALIRQQDSVEYTASELIRSLR